MKKRIWGFAATAALAALVAVPASAHRQWMLPSSTVLSGDDVWVTVDAAVSNDLFYFEHQPMRLDALKAWAPDGTEAVIENKATGRYRSTFDVHLTQKGTWRIASVSDGVMGSYDVGGKTERLPRGTTTANLAERIPAGATNVKTAESNNRNEIFVTVGEPTNTLFKPTGKGIELVPVTHPNDLISGEAATFQFLLDGKPAAGLPVTIIPGGIRYRDQLVPVTHPNDLISGEAATFQFLLDGKPAAGLPVTVIPGGIRYRDQLGQVDLKTGADGKVAIKWPEPGMYWLNVTTPQTEREEGAPEPATPQRRASYVTTLEVLAP